ncbi:MAG: ABC transporter ATP-binding protein [Bacteroidetes bacterium]|nr:ABC transporter ATP-binding protein [Bacteroidota bacterium]
MIEVKDLQFQYPHTEDLTLKGLNFHIKPGEIFGFLGPSGAGKSTAQKILYKTLTDYQGEVRFMDRDLKKWDRTFFQKIGVGFELPNHYLKLSGRENLDLFATFYSGKRLKPIEELFEMVELQDAIDKPVEAYSKGMKMRLNFIRAIQHNPDILFFDEPTAGLDPVNAHKIIKHIEDLRDAGKTIFITTHNMYTADELCDRVSFIVAGSLQITDSPENLKTEYGKEAVHVELQGGESSEFALQNLGSNPEFLSFLKQGEVARIHTMEATLDEVFINVTGKALVA